jgi:glycosyltransferase involved in cell wall biosynthesis
MKKILIITDEYPPRLGGAGIVAKTYLESLKSSYDLTLANASGVSVDAHYNFKKKSFIWPFQYLALFKKLKLKQYDIIILNDGPVQFAASLFFSSRLLAKSIVIIHGIETLSLRPSLLSKLFNYNGKIERVYNKAKATIGVSRYILQEAEQHYVITTANKKVIYTPTLIQKNNTERINFTLLSVGRIEYIKGFCRMYSIFKYLHTLDSRWTWTVIGDGKYLQELKSKAKLDSLSNSITFLGKIAHDKLAFYYSSHSVFLSLPECLEAFGLVYLEAITCGLPVVTYDRFGPAELVKNIPACIGVDFGTSIEEITSAILSASEFCEKTIELEETEFSVKQFKLNVSEVFSES